jgi:prepilin-type N-terminal cleavage/methylation domain-containing protein
MMNHKQLSSGFSRGFTLIELIIALLIGAIVTAMSVPMGNMVQSSRTSSIAYEFTSALNFARSEAIKRGNKVILAGWYLPISMAMASLIRRKMKFYQCMVHYQKVIRYVATPESE